MALLLEDLTEGGGNRRALEPDLTIVCAVDIPHHHVNLGVVALCCRVQHVVEGARSRQQRQQAPEGATPKRSAAYSLVGPRACDFEEGNAGANVDKEVGVDVVAGSYEAHGIGF